MSRLMRPKVWGLTPELARLCGAAAAGLLRVFVIGHWRIPQGRQSYFCPMVTLALHRLVYFTAKFRPTLPAAKTASRASRAGDLVSASSLCPTI